MDRTLNPFRGLVAAQESIAMRVTFVLGVVVCAAAAAAVGGKALALSLFILPALHDVPDPEAVQAMQHIVDVAIPPAFLTVLLGTGLYALALVGLDYLARGRGLSPWLALGTATYVLGVVLVTLLGMAGLEVDLLALDSGSLHVDDWIRYATAWGGFNNLRILAASVSCGFFLVAMLRR